MHNKSNVFDSSPNSSQPPVLGKNLPQSQSRVPKRLGTAALEDMLHCREKFKRPSKLKNLRQIGNPCQWKLVCRCRYVKWVCVCCLAIFAFLFCVQWGDPLLGYSDTVPCRGREPGSMGKTYSSTLGAGAGCTVLKLREKGLSIWVWSKRRESAECCWCDGKEWAESIQAS